MSLIIPLIIKEIINKVLYRANKSLQKPNNTRLKDKETKRVHENRF